MRFSKTYIFVLSAALFAYSCRHKKDLVKKDKEPTKQNNTSNNNPASNPLKDKLGLTNKEIKASKLYSFINDWYGVPYKYGGCQKTGVDCSCFADNLYKDVYHQKLGRTAGEIYKECDKVKLERIKEGDLVFFKINSSSISHVGVYLKDNKFVHASTSKGVMISDLNETYYKKYFYTAGRLKESI